jgi:hypothetical protein
MSLKAILLFLMPLLLWSCNQGQNTELQNKKGDKDVGQGAGDSENPDDWEAAQPVPVYLLDPSMLEKVQDNLVTSGAASSYRQAAQDDCASKINPMDTSLGSDGFPKNYCISFNIMTMPAVAAGEMKSLLAALISLSEELFGKNGFFPQNGFKPPRRESIYEVNAKAVVGEPRYAEMVVVDEENSLYRVNLYSPTEAGNVFELATSIEFKPLKDQPEFGDISLTHSYISETSLSRSYIEAKYNTKDKVFDADFGTAPIDKAIPSHTRLRWKADDLHQLFFIQGGYVWATDKTNRASTGTFRAPHFYSPYFGDVVAFSAVTADTVTAETVQRQAFLPAVSNKARTNLKLGNEIWLLEQAGYHSEVMRYLVELLRAPTVNAQCTQLKTLFSNALTTATPAIAVPAEFATLPDNVCNTNIEATDAQVEQLLTSMCVRKGVNLVLRLRVNNGTTVTEEEKTVSLCAKLNEGLFLRNDQYIFIKTSGSTRYRTPYAGDQYVSEKQLTADLLEIEPPTTVYRDLADKLSAEGMIDLSGIADKVWDPIKEMNNDYFKKVLSSAR